MKTLLQCLFFFKSDSKQRLITGQLLNNLNTLAPSDHTRLGNLRLY